MAKSVTIGIESMVPVLKPKQKKVLSEGLSYETIFCDSSYRKGFAVDRKIPDEAMKNWVNRVMETVSDIERPSVADLGCGLGRFTIPIAQALKSKGGRVLAIDKSPEMLNELRKNLIKNDVGNVVAQCGDIEDMEYNFKADTVFASEVLHTVSSLERVIKNAYGNSVDSAVFVVRGPSHRQLLEISWLNFFDKALQLDLERTIDTNILKYNLSLYGFNREISDAEIKEEEYLSRKDMLSSMRRKSYSILRLITDEEYNIGMTKFKEFIKHKDMISTRHNTTCIYATKS